MDINYYLQREQIERVRAVRAASPEARDVHAQLADEYRELLDSHRRSLLNQAGIGPEVRPPVL